MSGQADLRGPALVCAGLTGSVYLWFGQQLMLSANNPNNATQIAHFLPGTSEIPTSAYRSKFLWLEHLTHHAEGGQEEHQEGGQEAEGHEEDDQEEGGEEGLAEEVSVLTNSSPGLRPHRRLSAPP